MSLESECSSSSLSSADQNETSEVEFGESVNDSILWFTTQEKEFERALKELLDLNFSSSSTSSVVLNQIQKECLVCKHYPEEKKENCNHYLKRQEKIVFHPVYKTPFYKLAFHPELLPKKPMIPFNVRNHVEYTLQISKLIQIAINEKNQVELERLQIIQSELAKIEKKISKWGKEIRCWWNLKMHIDNTELYGTRIVTCHI